MNIIENKITATMGLNFHYTIFMPEESQYSMIQGIRYLMY